ncbi:hypothetical protein ACIRQP_36865 [Streptomyces sp. NPDC102274]|uniref:hypothetical protein n=1 Tax=Streptomyces sp. NPDC102274 TaxID=3366151 RepID=UPI00381796B2
MLLALALADLVWEVVKANLDDHARREWPWRLTVLDASACAAVVALLTGIIVARAQLSQTMHPVLSWSAGPGGSRGVADSLRTVTLINAGGGRAVVRSVAYRIRATPQDVERAEIPSGWISWHAAVDALASLGLDRDQDFFLLHLDSGAAVPLSSSTREGMELLALGPRSLGQLSALDIRIQVTDVLGDVHERNLQCIRPRPVPGGSTN